MTEDEAAIILTTALDRPVGVRCVGTRATPPCGTVTTWVAVIPLGAGDVRARVTGKRALSKTGVKKLERLLRKKLKN